MIKPLIKYASTDWEVGKKEQENEEEHINYYNDNYTERVYFLLAFRKVDLVRTLKNGPSSHLIKDRNLKIY